MVDLAGSERLAKTGTEGALAKEATYINKSLTFLEQVSTCAIVACFPSCCTRFPSDQCTCTAPHAWGIDQFHSAQLRFI